MTEPTPITGPIYTRRRMLLIGIETSRGTPVANPTLPISVTELSIKNDTEYADWDDTASGGGSGGRSQGAKKGSLSFKFPLLGNGTGTPDFEATVAALLNAAGLIKTNGVYKRARAGGNQVTITCWAYSNGKIYKLSGCAGNLKIAGSQGKDVEAAIDLKGVWNTPATGDLASNITYSDEIPQRSDDCVVTLDTAYAPGLSKWEIDLGWDVQPRTAAGVALLHFALTKGFCKLTADPESDGTNDLEDMLDGGDELAASIVVGTAVNNKCTIAIPRLQLRKADPGDRSEIAVHELEGAGLGEDDITITPA